MHFLWARKYSSSEAIGENCSQNAREIFDNCLSRCDEIHFIVNLGLMYIIFYIIFLFSSNDMTLQFQKCNICYIERQQFYCLFFVISHREFIVPTPFFKWRCGNEFLNKFKKCRLKNCWNTGGGLIFFWRVAIAICLIWNVAPWHSMTDKVRNFLEGKLV